MSCGRAVRADTPQNLANELKRLAREEPPDPDIQLAPMHAERYLSLVKGKVGSCLALTLSE